MEVECKSSPPPKSKAVLHGTLMRFSKASGRFFSFAVFLHVEKADAGALYLLDERGIPFSLILIGTKDVIAESSKASNAFSITGSAGTKTVLQAPTRAEKKEWIRTLSALVRGDGESLGPSHAPEVGSTQTSPSFISAKTRTTEVVREAAPTTVASTRVPEATMKGLLLKKGSRTGQYVNRWFEVIPGEGLLYAPYGDSPRASFQCIPLNGLQVVFDKTKRSVRVPPSTVRPRALILRCARAVEFVRWQQAIQEECTAGGATMANKATENGCTCLPQNTCDTSVQSPLPNAKMTNSATSAAGVGVMEDSEDLLELEDLCAEAPQCYPAKLLRSIETMYRPTRNTPGMGSVLQRYYTECLPYGLEETLRRLRQRLLLPITEPYEAVNEHMVLLDLDVQRVRECLTHTLRLYGEEVAVRDALREMDFTLCIHARVRERLLTRLEMAAFREQPNQCGLPIGVNGTIGLINRLYFASSDDQIVGSRCSKLVENNVVDQDDIVSDDIPTQGEGMKMWKRLYDALMAFRLEFDMFDESEESILIMEDALNRLYDWMERNKAESEELM